MQGHPDTFWTGDKKFKLSCLSAHLHMAKRFLLYHNNLGSIPKIGNFGIS